MFKLTKERQKKLRKNFIDVDNKLLIGEYSKNVISNGEPINSANNDLCDLGLIDIKIQNKD